VNDGSGVSNGHGLVTKAAFVTVTVFMVVTASMTVAGFISVTGFTVMAESHTPFHLRPYLMKCVTHVGACCANHSIPSKFRSMVLAVPGM
jgi:hypothetical protein